VLCGAGNSDASLSQRAARLNDSHQRGRAAYSMKTMRGSLRGLRCMRSLVHVTGVSSSFTALGTATRDCHYEDLSVTAN
jgi:hypothetical protein